MPISKKTAFIKKIVNFFDNNLAYVIVVLAVFIFGFSFGSMWKSQQLSKQGSAKNPDSPAETVNIPTKETPEKVKPVSANDHIFGAKQPKVTIIEFSDFGCPYSGRVHPTLKQLVAAYPNQVAWVYRHFLLGGVDSLTGKAAQMSECIATNNGNEKFWQFINKIYEKAEANDRVADETGFYTIARSIGINETELKNCIESGQAFSTIEDQIQGARTVGIGGTPALVIISSDNQFEFVAGAVPFEKLEETVKKYF